MASADELKSEIASGYDSLRAAIEGATDNWTAARPAAENVLRTNLDYAATIADVMESLKKPERQQFSLESQDDALSALTEVTATTVKVFGYVEDRDMEKRTPYLDTIGGVLKAAADQVTGAVTQIKAVS